MSPPHGPLPPPLLWPGPESYEALPGLGSLSPLCSPRSGPPGMGSAGRCSSATETQVSPAASCSKVRQGHQGIGCRAGGKNLTRLTQLCPARGARGAVDVVVGETDYQGFAILYLEQKRRLSVKLYGASTRKPMLCTLRAIHVGRAQRDAQTLPALPSLYCDPPQLSSGPGRSPCR